MYALKSDFICFAIIEKHLLPRNQYEHFARIFIKSFDVCYRMYTSFRINYLKLRLILDIKMFLP